MIKLIGLFLLGMMLMIPSAGLAGDASGQAEGSAYFDSRTGHKYLKTDNQTYMEFDRKGRFLKSVPNTLPLLVRSRSIHPLTDENYILYKKSIQGRTLYKPLCAVSPHPEGWQAHKLFLALN